MIIASILIIPLGIKYVVVFCLSVDVYRRLSK